MEELMVQLKRIADALEASNIINHEWTHTNKIWHKENIAHEQQVSERNENWIAWQKQQKEAEVELTQRWREENMESVMEIAREHSKEITEAYRENLHLSPTTKRDG